MWRCYLEGAPTFKVVTDHNPLIWFNTQTVLSRRQARWSEYLQRFDFEWEYRPGKQNIADPISRAPSLIDYPQEYLHDGLVLAHVLGKQFHIESKAVAMTQPQVGDQILAAITSSELDDGFQPGVKTNPAKLYSLLCVIKCYRGRTHLERGEIHTGKKRKRINLSAMTRSGNKNKKLNDKTPKKSNKSKGETVIPNSEKSEVHCKDTPPQNGNRFGASNDTSMGQDQNSSEQAESSEDSDESEVESMDEPESGEHPTELTGSSKEQLEGHSQMQKLLTEFLELVKEGYTIDEWFDDQINVKSLTRDIQGLYWKQHQLVIPDYSNLRVRCLELCHDAPWAGHFGKHRTQQLVRQIYWWPKMDEEIEQYVKTCAPCQRNKTPSYKAYGQMVPVQIPERRWSSISVDFITQLPVTINGYDANTVFVDRLTKRAHFAPCHTNDDAEDFAETFMKEIFSQHGLPTEIISDRDTKFIGGFWKAATKQFGITRCMSTAFHPRTDGQTERMNRTLEEVLRAYISPDQSDWDKHLPLVEFAINNTVNSSTGTTPFLMEYGQSPLTPASAPLAKINPSAFKFVANWEHKVKQAKIMLKAAQNRQKVLFDRKVQEKEFKIGQLVLVSTRNIIMKGEKGTQEEINFQVHGALSNCEKGRSRSLQGRDAYTYEITFCISCKLAPRISI